jgi:hypothetical protein
MYWTLHNLQDSENKQYSLHYSSNFSAATVWLYYDVFAMLNLLSSALIAECC